MVRVLALCLALASLTPVPAQTLAHSIPEETILYFRSWSGDPMAAMKKMLAGGGLWKSPMDIDAFVEQMDQGLAFVSGMGGLGNVNLGAWLRSIKGVEGALTRFVPSDGIPDMDFVLLMETPFAEDIYNLASGKLIEGGSAEEISKDEMEVLMGEFSLNVGRLGDRIVIASDSRQLDAIMRNPGGVRGNSLAQSKRFQRAIGATGVPDYCVYGDLRPWIQLGQEAMETFGGRRSGNREAGVAFLTAKTLGVMDLSSVGWNEKENSSFMSIGAEGPIPLFEILDSGRGGHEAFAKFPADCAVAAIWNGNAASLWAKAMTFALDETKFPMAAEVETRLVAAQKQLGFRFEDIAALGTRGMSMAFFPDERGRLDDDLDSFCVVLHTDDAEKARTNLESIVTKILEPRGGELHREEFAGLPGYTIKDMPGVQPSMVFDGNDLMIGSTWSLTHALNARRGQKPTLATYDYQKGLQATASAYVYVGLQAVMMSEAELASTYQNLRDGAAVIAAIDISPDRVTVNTSVPISQVAGAFAMSASSQQAQRSNRRRVLADLKTIAAAYRAHKAETGRDPTSMSQLKFGEAGIPMYPPNRPEGVAGTPYRLVSTEGADPDLESQTVVVICPDTTYGRLVGFLDGTSRGLSEQSYRAAALRQKIGQ